MRAISRSAWALLLASAMTLGTSGLVRAQEPPATGTNVQEGDNRSTTRQRGTGRSGDAVGGQVSGVVSGGRTSVDARNTSRDSSVQSGDVNGSNRASGFTGLNAPGPSTGAVSNLQTGDNRSTLSQTADASSGDAVGGQVIGAVTGVGGSSSIVASNLSENVDVTTGDADATNDADLFVGLNVIAGASVTNVEEIPDDPSISVSVTAISAGTARNIQDGDNRATVSQSAPASSGDGVAGQVIGAVTSGGASSIDATNASRDSSVETGDATSANAADIFVGLDAIASSSAANAVSVSQTNEVCEVVTGSECGGNFQSNDLTVTAAVVAISTATVANTQEGDNRASLSQSAPASSGDGVAGQVIGAVTSGGSSSIVAANTSERVDVTTGDADSTNAADVFVGLDANASAVAANELQVTQLNAACLNVVDSFCGENDQSNTATVAATVTAVSAATLTNTQDGDNRVSLSQSAPASSGDGVAGQVIGAVTSGGASSIDATNASRDSSVDTGDATSANAADIFAGLQNDAVSSVTNALSVSQTNLACIFVSGSECGFNDQSNDLTVTAVVTAISTSTVANTHEGDNRASLSQSAPASTGDGVGGQVIGAVTSGGSSSIVAANRSDGVDVSTGDADSTNAASVFVGLDANASSAADNDMEVAQLNAACVIVVDSTCGENDQSNTATIEADLTAISDATLANTHEGDNRVSLSQSAPASTGDGVAGQVIGAVTSGGASSIDATNLSRDSSVETGDADSTNAASVFVGLDANASSAVDNDLEVSQLNAACVIVVDSTCGENDQSNTATVEADLTAISDATLANTHEGDNRVSLSQSAPASTGDGVAGQVIGAVTSGGASSIVAANTSDRVDVETGDADSANDADVFVGLLSESLSDVASDLSLQQVNGACLIVSASTCTENVQSNAVTVTAALTAISSSTAANTQDGDNRASLSQSAPASTGDGVAGQVIGAVTSGGASSIDATNLSRDSSVETGDADSANSADVFVGLESDAGSSVDTSASIIQINIVCAIVNASTCTDNVQSNAATVTATITAVSTSTVANTQEGDNRASLSQSAPASTGDGVGGQVIGAVTSGGASSIVAANTSDRVDVETGDADSANTADAFVGLQSDGISAASSDLFVAQANQTCTIVTGGTCAGADQTNVTTTVVDELILAEAEPSNVQEGDNRLRLGQTASASTGDGVAGQVVGAVTSGGATSIDATNLSRDSSVDTGDADATNSSTSFVGLLVAGSETAAGGDGGILATDISGVSADNVQEGDNSRSFNQTAVASSGDAVAGQVTGVVTSAGGSASVVVANTSEGIDAESGESEFDNTDDSFVGLLALPLPIPSVRG